MKKNISSLELAALLHEFPDSAKIGQIYHQDREILFQLHVRGQGKKLLKIVPGKFLCFTDEKHPPLRPSGFCMQLRKYINNAVITTSYQQGAERIVVFEIEKESGFKLILELFSKGNIILTDEHFVVIGALQRQVWKDRTVTAKEKYEFPKQGVNWKELTEKELQRILDTSDKRNIAVTLATEVNLGGAYAEEICSRLKMGKDVLPKEGNAKNILAEIRKMVVEIKSPKGYIYETEITPFPLTNQTPLEVMETYNEAINTLKSFTKASPYEQKIEALKKMILEQEEQIRNLEQKVVDNTQKGELIYSKYADLQKLLDFAQGDWREVSAELKKLKKIESVNLKDRKVVVDL